MIGIYKITNKINNKCYVGQSVDIEKRWIHHKHDAMCLDLPLYRAIRKYGIENFNFEVLEECKIKDLDLLEIKWINVCNSRDYNYGYNLAEGGKSNRHFMKISTEILNYITDSLINTTDSYREIGERFGVSRDLVRRINFGITWYREELTYPLGQHTAYGAKKDHCCIDCGVKISKLAKRCPACATKWKYSNTACFETKIPTKELLIAQLKQFNFSEIGRNYNVSSNTVKKWCIKYCIPSHTKDLKKYLANLN